MFLQFDPRLLFLMYNKGQITFSELLEEMHKGEREIEEENKRLLEENETYTNELISKMRKLLE